LAGAGANISAAAVAIPAPTIAKRDAEFRDVNILFIKITPLSEPFLDYARLEQNYGAVRTKTAADRKGLHTFFTYLR